MDFVWKLYGNTYAVHVTVALVGVATLNLALPAPPGTRVTAEGRLKPKLSMFCAQSQNDQHLCKIDMRMLKQIVWETQNWHENFCVG